MPGARSLAWRVGVLLVLAAGLVLLLMATPLTTPPWLVLGSSPTYGVEASLDPEIARRLPEEMVSWILYLFGNDTVTIYVNLGEINVATFNVSVRHLGSGEVWNSTLVVTELSGGTARFVAPKPGVYSVRVVMLEVRGVGENPGVRVRLEAGKGVREGYFGFGARLSALLLAVGASLMVLGWGRGGS